MDVSRKSYAARCSRFPEIPDRFGASAVWSHKTWQANNSVMSFSICSSRNLYTLVLLWIFLATWT